MAQLNIKFDEKQLNRIKKRLEKMSSEKGKAVQDKLIKGAIAVQADAKVNIQQANHIDTGRLINSIVFESNKNKAGRYSDSEGNSFDGDLGVSLGLYDVVVGTNVNYAAKIEYDYTPFLRRAFYKNRSVTIDKIEKTLA